MSLKRKIVKNLGFLTLSEAVSSLLSFFLVVMIARLLGSEGLGIYSFAFAFAGLFLVFYDFGISTFFVREVAKNKKNVEKYFGNYASLRLIFCIVAMLLPMASILFMKRSLDVVVVVYLASIALFFQNYSFVARNAFQAYQEMSYDAITRVLERLIAFGLGWYVLNAGYGLTAFLLVLVFSNLISLIATILLLSRINIKFSLRLDLKVWKDMLKTSWPFWLSLIFTQIYFQIDTVMLSFMKGYEATGLYNAAYKLLNVISKGPLILISVLFPAMSQLFANISKQKELLRQTLQKGMQLLVVLGLPLIFGVTLLADRMIFFVYEQEFRESAAVLQVLIFAIFFMILSHLIGWFLNATNRQKFFTYSTGFCCIFNIALNAILIPPFSYVGASIATVLTALLNFVLLYYFSIREGYFINVLKLMARPLISSAIMGAFIFFWGARIHLLVLVPASAAIYFVLLALTGEIKKDDLKGIF